MPHATEQLRHRSRRLVALTAVAFLGGMAVGLVPSGDVARACSCAPPPPPLEALAVADAVFYGRVIRSRWTDDSLGYELGEAEVTFEVFDRWKGPETETFVLYTEGLGMMCGYHFLIGGHYIVYAFVDSNGRFETSNCTRTRPYDSAEEAALGPRKVISPVIEPPGVPCPDCAATLPPPEALAEADAVFHGWAVDLEQFGEVEEWRRRITFEVITWWKGGAARSVSIDLPRGYWGCYFDEFRLSARDSADGYIVYAHLDEESGRLELRLCDRTGPFKAEEAAALGPGMPPEGSVPTPTEDSTGEPPPTISRTPSTPGTPSMPTATLPATATSIPPFPIATETPTYVSWLFVPHAGADD